MNKILQYFHHIHHKNNSHKVHHCGGDHPNSRYQITHCVCGKHSINKKEAIGHDFSKNKVIIKFLEKCPKGGYHIESGKIKT